MGSSQRRVRNYRSRLSKRGWVRFEVLGRDSDRDLIRSLARCLAEDSLQASRLRAIIRQTVAGEPPRKGGTSPRFAAPLLSAPILAWFVLVKKGARSSSDALSARHQYYQQRR